MVGSCGFLGLLSLLVFGDQLRIDIQQQVHSNQALELLDVRQLGCLVGSQIVAVQLHTGSGIQSNVQFVFSYQSHGCALGGIQLGFHIVTQGHGDVSLGVALVGNGAGVELTVVEQDHKGLNIRSAVGGHFAGDEGNASHDGAIVELTGGESVLAAGGGINDDTNVLVVGHGGVAAHVDGATDLNLSTVDDNSLGRAAGCVHHLGKVDVIHEACGCSIVIHGIHHVQGGLTVLVDGGVDLALSVAAAGIVGGTLSNDLILAGSRIHHDPCVAVSGLHIGMEPGAGADGLLRLLGNVAGIGVAAEALAFQEGMLALLQLLTAFAGLPVAVLVILPGTKVGVLAGNQLGSDILQQAQTDQGLGTFHAGQFGDITAGHVVGIQLNTLIGVGSNDQLIAVHADHGAAGNCGQTAANPAAQSHVCLAGAVAGIG